MATQTPIPIYGQLETFYVPQVQVYASGQLLQDNVIDDILQVTYKDSVNEIDSFDITINNWDADYRTFKFSPPLKTPFPKRLLGRSQIGHGTAVRRIRKGGC